MSLPAFIAGNNLPADRMRAAYELQESIKARRKELEADEDTLRALMTELADIDDEVFVIANLRPVRVPDVDWIRENMFPVYIDTIGVSNSDAGKILAGHYSREELNKFLSEVDPELWEEKATIKITDFDRAVGGKENARRYEGTAYRTVWSAGTKTEIIYKRPGQQALPAGDD